MHLHLKQIRLSELTAGREKEPAKASKSWSVYARCSDDKFANCLIYEQLDGFSAKVDQKAALLALRKLVKVAAMGEPLQVHYDEKQCHELFRFYYQGQERIVWRIRNGAVRIPFYYAEGRLIFLPGIVVKRRDRLKKSEQLMLQNEVQQFIDSDAAGSLNFENNDVTQTG